jgi:hypothetical protein
MRAALTTGIERHGPDAVGMVLKGVPLCLFAIAGHYALGMSEISAALGSCGAAATYGLTSLHRAGDPPANETDGTRFHGDA